MVTLGGTIAVPGVRLTANDPTVTIVWVVESTLSSATTELVAYEARIASTGKLVGTGLVTTRTNTGPTFSKFPSRMPYARPGAMAPVEGFAKTFDGRDFTATGPIVITAIARGMDGSFLTLDTFWFINDTASDSTDTRPSSKVVYWAFGTGSDSNGGTGWGDAVATLSRAITLAETSGNCGGATIYVRGDVTGSGGIGTSVITTTTGAYHWLTFVADSGATWNGAVGDWVSIKTPVPGDFIRFRFQNFVFISEGPHFGDADGPLYRTRGDFWVEGGEWGSAHFDSNGVRARFGEDAKNEAIQFSSNTGNKGNVYVTGVYRRGCGICFTAHKLVYDCFIESFLAGDIYVSGPPYSRCIYHSLHFTDQAGVYNVTRGIGANQASGTSPREQLECQMIGPVMRILGPVGGSDFGTAMADNLGSSQTWAGVYDWAGRYPDPYPANPSLAGQTIPHVNNGVWEPLAAGQTGGRPYVDLDHPGGIAGMADLTWGGVETAQCNPGNPGSSGQRWNTRFHSSFLSIQDGSQRQDGTVIRDVAISNIRIEAQSHFSNAWSTTYITKLLIDNVRDACQNVSNFNMGGVDYLDCLFRRMSELVSTVGGDTGHLWTGTSFDNCVFNTYSGSMANMIANGLVVDYCHFISASPPAGSTNCTTGTWLDAGSSPDSAPWAITPDATHLGGGNPLMHNSPTEFAWDTGGSTKGCLKNVGLLNWDITPSAIVVQSASLAQINFGSAPAGANAISPIQSGALVGVTLGAPTAVARLSPIQSGAMASISFGAPTGANSAGEPQEPQEPSTNNGVGGAVVSVKRPTWWSRMF